MSDVGHAKPLGVREPRLHAVARLDEPRQAVTADADDATQQRIPGEVDSDVVREAVARLRNLRSAAVLQVSR